MHFIDNIKLILIIRGRNSKTHLTLEPEVNTILKTTDSNPTPQSLILHLKKAHPKIMSKFYEGNLFRGISNRSSCTQKVVNAKEILESFLFCMYLVSFKVHIFWEGHKILWLCVLQSKVRWRFRKIFRPSQNIWTLPEFTQCVQLTNWQNNSCKSV